LLRDLTINPYPTQTMNAYPRSKFAAILPVSLADIACLGALLLTATAVAQTAAPASVPADSPIELSPFVVSAEKDNGYRSTNTLSGTRTNEELKNLPNSISVMNRELLEDLAVTDFFQAADFAVGAANVDGNAGGANNNLLFRGLQTNFQSRDGFRSFVPLDTFNTERLEANRGPTALLSGDPSAGGILNTSTKQALFANRRSAQVRFDDWGSKRASLDVNRKLNDKLALRLNLLASDQRDWRDKVYTQDTGVALAMQWRISKKTTLRADGEWNELNRYQGHTLLQDHAAAYQIGTGSTLIDANPGLAGNQDPVGTNVMRAAGNNQRWTYLGNALYNLESITGTSGRSYRQSNVASNASATNPNNPLNIPLVSVSESVIPRTEQWLGPRFNADRDFYFYTITLEHRFADNLVVLLQHNVQDQLNTTTGAANNNLQLRRDPNPFIPNTSGAGEIANPNYDQLYVEYNINDTIAKNIDRNYRLTSIYDFETSWTKQRLVGSLSRREGYVSSDTHVETLTPTAIAAQSLTGAAAFVNNNQVFRRHYLAQGNSDEALADAPVSGITQMSADGGFWRRSQDDLNTASLAAFGHFFNDRLHTSLGVLRNHYDENRNNPNSVANPNQSNTPDRDPVTNEARSWLDSSGNMIRIHYKDSYSTLYNYGAVYFIVPDKLSIFYNYSETTIFNTPGTYFNGDVAVPQTGDGTDFGVRASFFKDRVSASLTFFRGTQNFFFQNGVVSAGMAAEMTALLTPVDGVVYTTGADTRDRESSGYEFELIANPTPQWTLRATLSVNDATDTNFYPRLNDALARMVALGGDPALYQNTQNAVSALPDSVAVNRYSPTMTTRYDFATGRLKGFRVGLAARWVQGTDQVAVTVNGAEVLPAFTTEDYYVINPFIAYTRKFGKVTWSGQINVNNVLDEQIRLGGYATGRYTAPRQVIFTNSFSF
jgi:outer membrane receptor protein involved in Fe transport